MFWVENGDGDRIPYPAGYTSPKGSVAPILPVAPKFSPEVAERGGPPTNIALRIFQAYLVQREHCFGWLTSHHPCPFSLPNTPKLQNN